LSNTWLFTTTVPASGFFRSFSKKIDKKKINLDRIMGEKTRFQWDLREMERFENELAGVI